MSQQQDRSFDQLLLVGSYTHSLPHVEAKGKGISLLGFNSRTGEISPGPVHDGLRNPTYLAISHDSKRLYSVEELFEADGAGAAVLAIDMASRILTPLAKVPALGDWPCHISLDGAGETLFLSNYLSGSFSTYALDERGLPAGEGVKHQRSGTGPNPDRQEGPHVHQATVAPDGKNLLICDAGTDEIARYPITASRAEPVADLVVKAAGGSLPRHLVFQPDGKRFFVVHELGCSVSSYAYREDGVERLAEASTLPEGWDQPSACAAIRLHPNGRFLYASNRGHDSIVAFDVSGSEGAMEAIGWYPTRGQTPRDFAIDPTGRYLIAANQDGHSLAVFGIDQENGQLSPVGDIHDIGSPVCILFVQLAA